MMGSMSVRSRKSSMSFRSCVALSRLRPKRIYAPGCTRRNKRAVSALSCFPGTPVMINCPSESAFMARKDERSTPLRQASRTADAQHSLPTQNSAKQFLRFVPDALDQLFCRFGTRECGGLACPHLHALYVTRPLRFAAH